MTSDDARLVMLKVRNLRKDLMDSYTYFQGIGNAYDKTDTEFLGIMESVYQCVFHMDRVSHIISRFATVKARDPEEWKN